MKLLSFFKRRQSTPLNQANSDGSCPGWPEGRNKRPRVLTSPFFLGGLILGIAFWGGLWWALATAMGRAMS